jgi:hypothetical protein
MPSDDMNTMPPEAFPPPPPPWPPYWLQRNAWWRRPYWGRYRRYGGWRGGWGGWGGRRTGWARPFVRAMGRVIGARGGVVVRDHRHR